MARKKVKREKKPKMADIFQALNRLEKNQAVSSKSLSRLEKEWQHQEASKTAFVTSAVPLTEKERKELSTDIGFIYGANFIIRNRVSPQVIGGLKIQVGSKIIDTTIETQLEKIKQSLMENGEK
jgi:F-type H+-transporting ATPase subunit delta